MKVAIATDNNEVSAHFGHCSTYTIFDIEDKKIVQRQVVETPPHEPGALPKFLNEKGASCVIAGGMGQKAQMIFNSFNISCILGVSGLVDDAINLYLEGKLESGASTCTHGQEGHGHGDGNHNCGNH